MPFGHPSDDYKDSYSGPGEDHDSYGSVSSSSEQASHSDVSLQDSDDSRDYRQRWLDREEQYSEELDHWTNNGPFTFAAVIDMVKRFHKYRITMEDELNDAAHRFDASELLKLNRALTELRTERSWVMRAWCKVTNKWHYAGDPTLLNDKQLKAVANNTNWTLCLREHGGDDAADILRYAVKLIRQRRLEARNKARRDASPRRRGRPRKEKQ